MSSTTSSSLTTDVSTDGLSTSQTNSTVMSSANTEQLTSTSTASAITTQSLVSTADTNTMTSLNNTSVGTTTTSTASFTTPASSDNSTHNTGNTTSVYPTTTDDNSGNITSSDNLTTALHGSYGTSSSINISTSASHVPVSSKPPDSWRSTQGTQGFSNVTTAGAVSAKHCPEPLLITGGKLLSAGPYLANVSSAVYSCLAGYTMTGQAEISCGITGSWDVQPPKCVPINRQPKVDNHISLEDSARVPLWLTVILCIAFGLLCLLLLACLLVYCLKIFSCWKGSAVGTKNLVREMGAESGDNSRGTMIADDYGSNGRYNGPKNFSYEENDERFRRPRGQTYNTASRIPVKSTGQGAKYGSGPFNQYNSREGKFQHESGGPYSHRPFDKDSFYRREMQEGKTNHLTGRFFRREAKMPAKQTWMPHSRNIRHINTSTK